MTILLTGGQGFLGGRVLEMLLNRGHRVRALVRRPAPELGPSNLLEICRVDLTDLPALRRAAEGVRGVIHCAAKSGVWGPLDDYLRANFVATVNLLSAARQGGARWFVHTSSPSVVHTGKPLDGVDEDASRARNPHRGYPYAKMLAEEQVLAEDQPGFRTVALRPHLIWGPGDPHFLPRLLAKIDGGHPLRLPKTPALVDGVFIDNAAEAHLLAAEKLENQAPIGGRAYFIAQGEPLTAAELVAKIVEAARPGAGPKVRAQLPPWLVKAAGSAAEAIWRLGRLSGEPPITSFVAEELILPHWFRLDRAKRDLGYGPSITMAEGLKRLALAYRSAIGGSA